MQLLPHQEVGRDFLVTHNRALLADGMRVGKSVQTIAACDRLNVLSSGLDCVICPATLREQWIRQFMGFSNDNHQAVVVSYEEAATSHRRMLARQVWRNMVIDESHFLKERKSNRTRVIYGRDCHGDGLVARAKRVWCLSGTPSPNDASELWPMLRALFPGVITIGGRPLSYMQFVKRYCVYENTQHGIKIVKNREENIGELKRLMSPVMLRRPSSVLGNTVLPPETMYLDATGRLKELQTEVRDALTEELRLAIDRAKTPEALELVMQRIDDGLRARLLKITGLAKAPALIARLKDELESGLDKVVVFGWHTEVLDMIGEELKDYGAVVSHGKVPTSERDANALRFQSDKACRVIAANIKAEGVGRDYTAACELIFAETSWVPGDNEQAAMRITGVNQKRAARVRYAVLPGSIDERLTEVNRRKSEDIRRLFG